MIRLAALAICVLAGSVRADPEDDRKVAPCRPTVTCTADLAPPGTLEIELGYQLRRIDEGSVYEHGVPLLAKMPFTTWLEAQLGSNGYTVTPMGSYFDNVTAGAKLHLLDQAGARPSIALTVTASIPTASQRGYTRIYDLFVTAHASKDYGSLHLDWNVGVDAWQLAGPTSAQPFTALAATYAVTPRTGVTLEPHYFADASPIAPRDVGLVAAATYSLRSWLVVDVAADVVVAAQASATLLVGVSLAPIRVAR